MKQFVYTEVESSNIAQVGYNAEDQLLEILFKNGGKYWYPGVPSAVKDNLITSESVGKFFHANIKKGPYPFIKVTNMVQDSEFDACYLLNQSRIGTTRYKRFSDLCIIMEWDHMDAWDKALHRSMWLEYQDEAYLASVQKLVDTLSRSNAQDFLKVIGANRDYI